jgi:hypothetical protein
MAVKKKAASKKTASKKVAKKKVTKKPVEKLSAAREALMAQKDDFTKRGEPWVGVVDTHFDPENPSAGYFELDWNPIFIAKLLRAGYTGKNEEDIVNLCKGVLADTYEEVTQMQGTTFIQRRTTDDGKTEIS